MRHLDDADLQGSCSIKKVIVRALLAKFIFDQKLYDENDVILADGEVVRDIALKFSGEYGFHASLSPENIARWQDSDSRKAKLQYEFACLSSVSSRAKLDNIFSLLNTLQDIIITQFKTGRHQERCLIGASQFLAEILLEFFNQKSIKNEHIQAVVTQKFYSEPFLDEVYDLISVEELVSAGEAYPIFHVIIQDGILDVLQNQLRKMYAKYQYQTDEQLNVQLDPGISSKTDELMSFLLRYRAKSALLQPNLIEPILSSPDIETACETMIRSIRALTRPVNTAFCQHTKMAIQLALSTHDVDSRVKQQIEDLAQSFIDTLETSADPKIDLIRSYKQQIDRVFTHAS